jgi:hypothetical protein
MVSMVEMHVTSVAFPGIERYPSLRQGELSLGQPDTFSNSFSTQKRTFHSAARMSPWGPTSDIARLFLDERGRQLRVRYHVIFGGRAMNASNANGAEPVLNGLASLIPNLEALYKDVHAHPELSMQETRTAGLAAERLRAAG